MPARGFLDVEREGHQVAVERGVPEAAARQVDPLGTEDPGRLAESSRVLLLGGRQAEIDWALVGEPQRRPARRQREAIAGHVHLARHALAGAVDAEEGGVAAERHDLRGWIAGCHLQGAVQHEVHDAVARPRGDRHRVGHRQPVRRRIERDPHLVRDASIDGGRDGAASDQHERDQDGTHHASDHRPISSAASIEQPILRLTIVCPARRRKPGDLAHPVEHIRARARATRRGGRAGSRPGGGEAVRTTGSR